MKSTSFLCYCFPYVAAILASKGYGLNDYGTVSNNLKKHVKDTFKEHESYKSDFLKADDHGDFELADIIYLSQSSVNKNIDAYSSIEKRMLVNIHNVYRSNLTKPFPKGSNLQYVLWNDTLAWNAKDWLKQCKFERGFGKHDNMTFLQGQNLYRGPSKQPSRALYLWYEEYKNFFFENFTCKYKNKCHHMTQMLWFDSSNIGCARKSNCFPLQTSEILVNCHYFRSGNKWNIGTEMYKYGWPCTRCELSESNLCFNNLCVSKGVCTEHKLSDCECKVNCKNCVKPNYKKCRCEPCKLGWDWKDCSFPCIDSYDFYVNKPGFCRWKVQSAPKKLCGFSEVSNMCRRACNNCASVNLKYTKNLCCGGKVCQPYHVLDDKCNCIKDCPSNVCLYPPRTTSVSTPMILPLPNKTSDSTKSPNATAIPIILKNITSNSTESPNETAIPIVVFKNITSDATKSPNETTIPIVVFKNITSDSTKSPIEMEEVSKAHRISAVRLAPTLFSLSVLFLFT